MSKSAKKAADQAEREKVHKRYSNRREPDVIYPAKKQVDFYDADIHQRVAVYVRVSTDNLGQETSYELQKNYYEEFVLKHPNWKLVKIYADKGISGTSTKHRVELNQMLADSRAGKIDLIITKSVSRLARNTVDCITMVFIQSYLMTGTDSPISGDGELSPLSVSGKRVRAVPKKLADRFGSDFYSHRLTSSSPELQSEDAWKLWLEGQLFETGEKLRVTKFDEMQRFIAEQLAPIKQKDEVDFNA